MLESLRMPFPRRTPLDEAGLWEYALRSLAQRAQTVGEISTRLRQRAANPDCVPAVIEKLKEYGCLNDRALAENYATVRVEGRGLGKMRILRDLRQRRVASGVASDAVDKAFEGVDETELAIRFLERKFRGQDMRQLVKEPKKVAAAYRRLRYAGFGTAATTSALKKLGSPAEIDELAEGDDGQ